MKTKLLLLAFLIHWVSGFSQTIAFGYNVKLKPLNIPNLPGLHSCVVAQSGGKWLIIGGRKDGLHARQPFSSFPAASNNTDIYVIDINSKQFWQSSVNALPVALAEQLQSTNMNFYQDEDSLYIIGGYGYSATAANHITFPNLTSVRVSGLINAVVNGNSILPYFKQITDQNFAVNGAQLGKIDSTFYLVGGHRFDGRYNPMNNPTYTQTYVNGIKKFKLNNSGVQLSYSGFSVITDQVHLHRRDYNLVPQVFPNGEQGYMISSGVFQTSVNLPFLYPVYVTKSGHTPVTTFNQYLSNYHSAKSALYDSVNNVMHSVFYGGMSQYMYVNNVLTQDNNVPFVKTISRVSRDASGNLQESAFTTQMPALIGASAEFIVNHNIPHYRSDIIKLSQIVGDSVLIGHIYGGIYSPQPDAFTVNNTGVTNAHSTIYEVWLLKEQGLGLAPINGKNPLQIELYPNPGKLNFSVRADLPEHGNLELLVTDVSGKIVFEKRFVGLPGGKQTLAVSPGTKLATGVYFLNFTFNGKYSAVEKLVLVE